MSNGKRSMTNENEQKNVSAESVIDAIRALVKVTDALLMVDVGDPTVSGAVVDPDDGEWYREEVPLGEGVHLVISFNLPTKLGQGIWEME